MSTRGFWNIQEHYNAVQSSLLPIVDPTNFYTFGIWSGGYRSSPQSTFSTANRINFVEETRTIINNFQLARAYHSATTGNNSGWFAGGFISGFGSQNAIEKFNFSTDNSSLIPSTLTTNRSSISSFTGNNLGWFAGGFQLTTIDKLDFSSETVTLSPGRLSGTGWGSGAAENKTSGWIAGSQPTSTIIERLTFSTDTITLIPAKLSLARGGVTGTPGNDFGWFAGGWASNLSFQPTYSTIDKLNFSTETSTVLPTKLSTSKRFMGAGSGQGYAWFAGTTDQFINKIEFSNDTRTISSATLSYSWIGTTATEA